MMATETDMDGKKVGRGKGSKTGSVDGQKAMLKSRKGPVVVSDRARQAWFVSCVKCLRSRRCRLMQVRPAWRKRGIVEAGSSRAKEAGGCQSPGSDLQQFVHHLARRCIALFVLCSRRDPQRRLPGVV